MGREKEMERETGFEPATTTLARWSSTGLSYSRSNLYRIRSPERAWILGKARSGCQRRITIAEDVGPGPRTVPAAPFPPRAAGRVQVATTLAEKRRPCRAYQLHPCSSCTSPGDPLFSPRPLLAGRVGRATRAESASSGEDLTDVRVIGMTLRVLKFGGTSVETPTHILSVSRRILRYRQAGDQVVVVVSAMGQTTDELIHLAHRVAQKPPRRELDMLLTAGERISMALLAMALESQGCSAISFTGSQSGIVTSANHTDARIQTMRPFRIEQELARGRVAIVAGFQGVSIEKEITTLGRGGSDTTAVALAVRLGADSCEIYTDVDGVLTADPRVVPTARRLERLPYAAMIAFSHFGGRVLFQRAVVLARKYHLPVEVRSSLHYGPGTRIVDDPALPIVPCTEETEPMESNRIVGVALESPVAWVRVLVGPSERAACPFPAPGSESGNNPAPPCLLFARQVLPNGTTLFQWVSPHGADLDEWLAPSCWGNTASVTLESHAALVTVVGEAATPGTSVTARVESTLTAAAIPIWGLQTGAHSVSALVPERDADRACRLLHDTLIPQGS